MLQPQFKDKTELICSCRCLWLYESILLNHCFSAYSCMMIMISGRICSPVAEKYSPTQRSLAPLGPVVIPSFYVKVMSIISVSSNLFELLSSDSCGGPIFCTFKEAALPPSSRNEVRNENTVFFEASSEVCTTPSSQPCCYEPAIDLSISACVLDAAPFAGVVEQPRTCVGARLCVIDGDSLQIYWRQKTLA